MNRYIRLIGGLLCILLAGVAHAEWRGRMTQNDAIDIAGMQRMLSQRIMKAYCEVGLAESYGTPQSQLKQAVDMFDANLYQLDGFVKTPDIRKALDQVRAVWPDYKALALMAPSREGARQLMTLNRKLLPLAQAVVVRMAKDYGTATGKMVNIAGRQRMLSQRIAMFYLMHIWGVATEQDDKDAKQAAVEYATALKTLRAFSGNTDEMNKLIDDMGDGLHFIEHAVDEKGDNLSFIVAVTSEKMLENADKLTAAYAKMGKK